ncbi:hypothetical protein PVV74_19165 [Roseovarius sp. SK2]|uniref:hypothetical protein n=1 Tax=Roseovarius sp. SK2 TaxID=3028381 RepID=UPI00237A771E|nr:hypothetical protein [Roseovarius sp. SK2]MDD9727577.1 hypothetical protein [Roseovarius sp. SK2]
MLSLRTMLDPDAAGSTKATVVFVMGAAQFTARLADGAMPVTRGAADEPDLRFEAADAPSLAAVFYGGVDPDTAGLRVAGDPELARTFIALFNLPAKLDR